MTGPDMSGRTVELLRTTLQNRAEHGMFTTDTDRELSRLQDSLRASTRRRRVTIAALAAAAAAIVAGAALAAVDLTGNDRAGVTGRPLSGTKLVPPPGLSAGVYQRSGAVAGQLILNDDGTATLGDVVGSNREALRLVSAGIVRFAPPAGGEYCSVSGTYRYAVAGSRLTFTRLSDTCTARVQFLTLAAWTRLTGGSPTVVPAEFPTGRLEISGSPTQIGMTVSPDGGVTLSDSRGDSRETLSFPAPGSVSFSKDGFFCPVAGTYHYAVTATTVRFTVTHDTCADRRTFLTSGVFTKTG